MDIALITGANGLIGSESVKFFAEKGFKTVGIDNDLRKYFFGKEASTLRLKKYLEKSVPGHVHYSVDIRNLSNLENIFKKYSSDIKVIIHAASQPSHDWAAKEPLTDFGVNAQGTLNLLELTRQYCPKAVFEFCSTNKVYGDTPNTLPLIELKSRWEIPKKHKYFRGIDESMTIDQSMHSLFGASKVAADILVQEYGRYFGIKTVCFRGGCLTGPNHSGAMLHGFLSYLMKCAVTGQTYTVFGYKGKQVRDNIHSYDFVNALWHFYIKPRCGEVYNMGGGRQNSCSVLEAIELCEKISGRRMNFKIVKQNRIGDHIWYISDLTKFKKHFPQWHQKYSLKETIQQIYIDNVRNWKK